MARMIRPCHTAFDGDAISVDKKLLRDSKCSIDQRQDLRRIA